MDRRLLALAASAALAAPAFAQLSPEKALATMKPIEGFQVELFAAEPMLINPTAIDVDPLGRVWVAEAVNYRRKNFNRPILRPEGDRIVILTDKDGDGKADDSTVFYQGPDVYGPLSVLVVPLPSPDRKGGVLPCRVLVAQSPDILEFVDADGDGKADGPPKKFLTGFGGFDHDHGVHGLTIGPDGKLYFTVGDAGVTALQSSDGTGKKWKSNDSDVQKGTVWKCDLDGKNVELIAHNFRNNYEACVDSFGEIWLSDNDDDGNQQTRICHVMPGGNYGYGPRGPGQTHWHEEQPGIVHKTLRTGFGSPTGICFNEGTLFGAKYHGALLHCDAGPREVRAFFRKPKGAGYELDKDVILTSTDNFFRPSDVCIAPDGSIIVADWYDRGVGGHGMGDPKDGRIYRLTPKGSKGYTVPAMKLDSKDGLVQALASPNVGTRAAAVGTINGLSVKEALDAIFAGLASNDATIQARSHYLARPTAMRAKPEERDERVRAEYGKFIQSKAADPKFLAMFVRSLPDFPAPKVDPNDRRPASPEQMIGAREILLTLRNREVAIAKPIILTFARFYDGQDIFFRAALNIACGTDPVRRDAILADFDKEFPEWNDKVADLVWELRPKSMLPKMDSLLADEKVSASQKGRIVDILASSDDAAAGKTMLGLLKGDAPPEVKARAIDNLKLFLPTKWNALSKSDELKAAVAGLLADPKTTVTGLQLISAANYAAAIDDVIRTAGNGTLPGNVREEAILTLGKIKDIKAVDALTALIAPKYPFALASIRALGEQLPSGQKSTPAADKAMLTLQQVVLQADFAPEWRTTALTALSGNRGGTGWLLKLKEDGKLPEDLSAQAGRLLRNSPFQGERNKALLLFPAPGKMDIAKLPPLSELAKRKGNAELGKAILAKSLTNEVQCLKCHTVRGQGGQIGPDLSMIGKKGSRENLFESILYPSKAIADQYVNWKLDTEDGQSITGLIVQETPTTITLRDANGKDYQVPVKGTDKKKSPQSLMADNLVAGFSEDDLVDVVEYLSTLQTASLTPDSWYVVGPFDNPEGGTFVDAGFPVTKAPFDATAKFKGKAGEVGWKPVRITAAGYVDLAALHGDAAAKSVSFAYREIESPADQEVTILLGTDDGSKLTVNGETAFSTRETRAAAPGQNEVKVKFKKGTNTLLLRIANGDNPHGFFLTVSSDQELKLK